ncbi:degV family protein [Bacillus anthracis]|nr:DegV family protein [Bacillus anthracis str. CDC 684]ACQ50191.1 degV family protein [Bacillus anthracis str. A0248]AFH83518.1 DegV family protein [Bacillus anthracis str. H9401]AHK38305.1 DegV family protein [Bacillus anthracis str. SVA11]AIM06082.1 degV family protein [Bacillus anthracis]EDR19292.1 degV family protein [Bacillus anthracis str. A0488]EDR85394.1 degV family protein [Bacillus anthracis str. A0193]EDR94508.1 degV family protein [Bacillus anthracis str. A0442]EDS97252.1 degV 
MEREEYNMQKIKIVTDSTADLSLSQEVIEKYDIHVLPLSISVNGQTYLDRVDLQPDEFIEEMIKSEELPKTSQPAMGTFVEMYDKLGEDGSEVLSIHMTSGMSGTVATANSAASMTDTKVTVVDSQFITHALAYQVVEAAKMANEGRSLEEILKRVDEVRKNTRLYVVVDTLENLVKGGRIGKGKAFIGSLLNIKPIASLEDGVYNPVTKVRSQGQIVKTLAKLFEEDTAGKVVKAVAIPHAKAIPLAENVKAAVEKVSGFAQSEIFFTTPIISTHTGPGAIGFMYLAE